MQLSYMSLLQLYTQSILVKTPVSVTFFTLLAIYFCKDFINCICYSPKTLSHIFNAIMNVCKDSVYVMVIYAARCMDTSAIHHELMVILTIPLYYMKYIPAHSESFSREMSRK